MKETIIREKEVKIIMDQSVFKTFKNVDDVLNYLEHKEKRFWKYYKKKGEYKKNNITYVIKYKLQIRTVHTSGEQLFDEEETKTLVSIYNALQEKRIDLAFTHNYLNDWEIPVEKAIEASRKLNDWVSEIKSAKIDGKELSPYEKYLYAYDIVTKFSYKEEDKGQDQLISRHLMHILTGDRIVCVGYANLLSEICNRLSIPCYTQTVNNNHEICYVRIDDDKWDIHGIYASNPTYDRLRLSIDGKSIESRQGFAEATIIHEDYIKENVLNPLCLVKKGDDQTELAVKDLIKFFSEREKNSSPKQIEDLLYSPSEISRDTTIRAYIATLASKNIPKEEQLKIMLSRDTVSFVGTDTFYHSLGVTV